MKNITVSVADEAYRRARIRAAERNTSVSALVREFFESLDKESDFERRSRLEREVMSRLHGFDARDRLSRDDVHDRRKVR